MAYTTYAGVKNYLGIASSADDALFTTLIDRAQAAIDNHCRRTFEAGSDTTRLVSVEDADGLTLVLADDLCSITSITNNADGVTEESLELTTNQSARFTIGTEFNYTLTNMSDF